jgi:methylthioribose-1-phosphate isomerase
MRPFEQFAIRYTAQHELQIIDQILLPDEERWITAATYKDMIEYIKRLSTRGECSCRAHVALVSWAGSRSADDWSCCEPGIGAGGCEVGVRRCVSHLADHILPRPGVTEAQLRDMGAALRASRPTAVNL